MKDPKQPIIKALVASNKILQNALDNADKSTSVRTSQVSLFDLQVTIGTTSPMLFHYPVPVTVVGSDLRINRKSYRLEIEAPLATPLDGAAQGSFTGLLTFNEQSQVKIVCTGMPYINLAVLPTLPLNNAASLEWLGPHLNYMFSKRERALLDGRPDGSSTRVSSPKARVDFKEALTTMFIHAAGIGTKHGQPVSCFALGTNLNNIHFILVASSMRLDSSSRSVALDAAALPFNNTTITPDTKDAIKAM